MLLMAHADAGASGVADATRYAAARYDMSGAAL